MRRPKFEMGQLVNAALQYENKPCAHTIDTVQDATVCGIEYDPHFGGTGAPWYYYQILVRGAHQSCRVAEDKLFAKETE